MKPTDKDFEGIDLHGMEVQWHEYEPDHWEPFIELEEIKIFIERRHFYCDRGRYGFWAESKDHSKMSVDYCDGFPRYFLSLQRAMDELNDWITLRALQKVLRDIKQ